MVTYTISICHICCTICFSTVRHDWNTPQSHICMWCKYISQGTSGTSHAYIKFQVGALKLSSVLTTIKDKQDKRKRVNEE